jgi:hypothetical protein
LRSNFLKTNTDDSFFDDLKALALFPRSIFEELIKAGEEQISATGRVDPKQLLPILNKHDLPYEKFYNTLATAIALLKTEQDEEDPVEAIVSDAIEIGKLDESVREDVLAKLEFAKRHAFDDLMTVSRLRQAVTGAFPVIAHLHSRSIISPMITPRFNRLKDKPENYSPSIEELVPVTMVQLDLDEFGQTKSMSFGLSEAELEGLINHLQLAHKELKALKKHLNLGEV